MALEKLLETNNFEDWLAKINEIIDSLGATDGLASQLLEALTEAIERNQVSEYLGSPETSIVVPDGTENGTTIAGDSIWSWDWNEYTSNGVYWIPWSVNTLNAPLGLQESGMCWVASGGANGPVVQLAVVMRNEDEPVIAVRYGAPGENGPEWPMSGQACLWTEIPSRKYLDENFLNKTTSVLQTVTAPVRLLSTLDVDGDLTAKSRTFFKGRVALQGLHASVIISPDDSSAESQNAERFLTVEVSSDGTLEPDVSPNLPLWNTATGQPVDANHRQEYKEPIWIDKEQRTASINGTAEYARFVVPDNMISEFDASKIAYDQLYLPVTAKAVKDLFNWTKETYLPLAGGVLKGVVRHEEDIFLDHIKGIPENRTAAIRSPARALQLQGQGSGHFISNTKQASFYIEKEDADSAEYTTEHHDASFIFRKVVLDKEMCLQEDGAFTVINSDPELDGYWICVFSAGTLKVFENGTWEFSADEARLDALGPDEVLRTKVFYKVVNAVTGASIASRCQHEICFKSGDYSFKTGTLSINDIYYQIVLTDTDWTGLPVTIRSRIGSGSKLVDGSLVAAGSVLNGDPLEEDWTVNGLLVAYGVKEESDSGSMSETPALLTEGSIIRQGSIIKTDSMVNGRRWTNDKIVNSDIRIAEESTLMKGSLLKSGSVLALNSVANGFQYLQNHEVHGESLTEESVLTPGSRILLGSLISTSSAMNGIPGKSGFLEVLYGLNPEELNGSLANGSTILPGSTLAPGSVVNEVEYSAPTIVEERIIVDGRAVIAHTSKLAAGSYIEESSILNGLKWTSGMPAAGIDEVLPLSREDLAPVLYVRTYDNIQGRWTSEWEKSSYRSIYPSAAEFDSGMWFNWISNAIDNMEIEDAFATEIKDDLRASLIDADRSFNYPLKGNADNLLVNGKWSLDKSSSSSPDHVFEMRCYVASHSRTIGVEKILVQPFRPVYDASGARTGLEPVHDAAVIFQNSLSLNPSFLGEAFEYFNFKTISGSGSAYTITYDTRLIPEWKNLNQKKIAEILVFTVYGDGLNASNAPVMSFEKIVSLDIENMMGAPFVFGARTRTGITSEGQLGDPLYDLGCVEITEDSLSLKLRKKSVSMQSEIKKTAAIVFERLTDNSGRIVPYISAETSNWCINGEDTGFPAVGDNAVSPRVENGFWWIGGVNTGYQATPESYSTGIALRPSVNGVDIGTPELRFRNVYLEGDPIVSSDKTLKTDIAEIPDSLLKKWSKVKWMSFKFKDSVEAKGKNARIHSGVIAQDVKKALSGMDVSKWSFFCRDSWDERKESEWVDVPAGVDEFGVFREAHTERRMKKAADAGEQYSIRYQEMQCIENAYLRKEIEKLKKEVEILKQSMK